MDVYLRAKFEVSSIILTGLRQGIILPSHAHLKTNPKKPTQIRVKTSSSNHNCQKKNPKREADFDKISKLILCRSFHSSVWRLHYKVERVRYSRLSNLMALKK